MFRDKIKIFVKAGDGGNGVIKFDIFHRPIGGNGGDGGNVYLRGIESEIEYKKIKAQKTYSAEIGNHGGKDDQTGARGEDYFIPVPLVTCVYDENGEKIGEVSEVGQELLIQKGGRGGLGNYYFRRGGADTLEKYTNGNKVEPIEITLELEIKSDIVFIGLPNAGKSSLLNELTNAESKVGAYSFTTLNPIIGTTREGIKLLDLPGLIEDTSLGRGLGTRFEKHTRRTNSLAHFVSLESKNPIVDYKLIRTEIAKISKKLSELPEIIILTKDDELDEKEVLKLKKAFQKINTTESVSILSDVSVEKLYKSLQDFIGQLATE